MPVLSNRSVGDFPVANIPIHVHRQSLGPIQCHPDAWLDPGEVSALKPSGPTTLLDAAGIALAHLGATPDPRLGVRAKRSFLVRHSWELLRAHESHFSTLGPSRIHGEIHPHAVIDGRLHLGAHSRILPGVYIEGNVVIGEHCKIGPNCYLRGHTAIGDHCHIGQAVEIKNSIILSRTSVGHLSYVGDSILGENVNFGAGTITSNFRHDGATHRSMVNGKLVDTGRRKFGSIVGDGVHTGIHTSIYPGRKFLPGTSTRPGEIVQYDLYP